MPRLTAALAAVLLVVAALLGSLLLNAQTLHGSELLYTTPPSSGEAENTSTNTAATTTVTITTTTAPRSTPTQPPCRNESLVWAQYSGAIFGKGILAACLDGKDVEVEFHFIISGSEVEYGGVITVRGEVLVSVYSYPLSISLVTGDGKAIYIARASGDRVDVSDYYRFKYSSSISTDLTETLRNVTSVIIEMPFNTTSATYTLKGVGEVEVYVPRCSLDVTVILNKTKSNVEVPQGYRGVTLEAPGDGDASLSVLAYNEGGTAVVDVFVSARADKSEAAADMAVIALEWLLTHGILQGVGEEDLSGASQAVMGVILDFCSRGSSLSIVVYWNGTAWDWMEKPPFTPTTATPMPTPTTTTVSPITTKVVDLLSKTRSRVQAEEGKAEARGVMESGLANTKPGTSVTSVAGAETALPVSLLVGLTVGAVAAVATWLLARRV
jgi:hypothetical protein